MQPRNPIFQDVRRLLVLSAPVIASQLGMMMLGVVDLLMVGKVGVRAVGAVTLGNLWIMGTMIFGMGVVFGMDPVVSQAHGAGDGPRAGRALHHGLVTGALMAVPITVAWLLVEQMLLAFGQDAGLARDARNYVWVQIPSILPFLAFTAYRQYLLGRNIVMPSFWVILVGNLVNVALNYVLIFGGLGIPPLGAVGAGIASALVRFAMLGAILVVIRMAALQAGAWVAWSRESFDPAALRATFRMGLPIGLQYGSEMWAFQVTTLLAGRLGELHLSAHAIVLNLASISFMIPLGLSFGAATRVGNLIGAGDLAGSRRAGRVALVMGAAVMGASALSFLLLREWLPALYFGKAQTEVIALAASILPIAAAFQLFDGIQAVGGGILRGRGRPRPAAVINLLGYYLFALPLAWWLSFHLGLGLAGLWWGLAAGLAIVAGMLVLWILRTEGQHDHAAAPSPHEATLAATGPARLEA